jgi:dTDP-4-dehydrorhamnose 3,5-epimerase
MQGNNMHATPTKIADVLIIEPKVFGDARGFFYESFNQQKFNQLLGYEVNFVQDNHSRSVKNVLRGLHYQIQHPQGKLVRATHGAVLDVVVDMRKSSTTFGQHISVELSAENKRMVWIPPGFAHGFVVLSESAEFLYKTTDYWYPEHERSLLWCDATVAIDWALQSEPTVSAKDALGKSWAEAEFFA